MSACYYYYYCHHQNDSRIKMGSDVFTHTSGDNFNVTLIVRDKVTKQCPQTTTFFEEKGEPKRNRAEAGPSAYQPNALPLGQTGSKV